jgi:hypothetical protein
MTIGYSRTSVADIINGANITAPPLNAEFNAIADAFNGTSGHSHSGTSSDGAPIPLGTSVVGYLLDLNGGVGGRNNTSGTTDPSAIHDSALGYSVGSIWINTSTNRVHICQSNQASQAVWFELNTTSHLAQMTPKITNTIDIGSAAKQYQDIYIDGIGYIDTILSDNISTTANINVNGLATVANLTATGSVSLGSTTAITGGTINNTVIGGSTPSAVSGTVITATSNFAGALTGNVTGNLTGNTAGTHTGPLSGDVTSSGTSNFVNVAISGTLDMDAGTTATVTNLATPVNNLDAATKGYVDTSLANLVDAAPNTLNTLNELAASLADDASFANTMTTALGTKLPLAGGTMSGNLDLGTNKITSLGTPTGAADAATKGYVDTKLPLAGGTLTGALALSNNKITGLGTPTAATDATTKTYVDGILTSGENASLSAANASTSETNAAASAVLAQNWAVQTGSPVTNGGGEYSAKHYANLASAANAAVANFFDTYFVSSGEPSGSNLGVGDLWYDTTNSLLKVYTSSGFINVNSSVNGTTNRYEFVVGTPQNTDAGAYSGSTTVFPATYDQGFLDVYKNGVRLLPTQFTATDGQSLTLSSAATSGDTISLIGYGNFQTANHYSKTQSDIIYGQKIIDLEDEILLQLGV